MAAAAGKWAPEAFAAQRKTAQTLQLTAMLGTWGNLQQRLNVTDALER
jgi:hypothetical protein